MAFKLMLLNISDNGETKLIGKDEETPVEKVVDSSTISLVDTLVERVFSKKPEDNSATSDFLAVNIVGTNDGIIKLAEYTSKNLKGFIVRPKDLNKELIDAVVKQVLAAPAKQ